MVLPQPVSPEGISMSKPAKAEPKRVPFKQMSSGQKAVYVFQAVVCICTFGFVFPNFFG
jgi:hypothetical protein